MVDAASGVLRGWLTAGASGAIGATGIGRSGIVDCAGIGWRVGVLGELVAPDGGASDSVEMPLAVRTMSGCTPAADGCTLAISTTSPTNDNRIRYPPA
jgi:hypothetical protein